MMAPGSQSGVTTGMMGVCDGNVVEVARHSSKGAICTVAEDERCRRVPVECRAQKAGRGL